MPGGGGGGGGGREATTTMMADSLAIIQKSLDVAASPANVQGVVLSDKNGLCIGRSGPISPSGAAFASGLVSMANRLPGCKGKGDGGNSVIELELQSGTVSVSSVENGGAMAVFYKD